jgi:hypothetical protein
MGHHPFQAILLGLLPGLSGRAARDQWILQCGALLRGAQTIVLCVVIGTTASVQRCSLHGAGASRGFAIRQIKLSMARMPMAGHKVPRPHEVYFASLQASIRSNGAIMMA